MAPTTILTSPLTYSVIIPVKNEEENIAPLLQEIEPVMKAFGKEWELICIDDGSTDGSLKVLKELAKTRPYLRLIVFSKNCGQSSAFDAGFKAARGTYIITLDADGQNDPADIPKLVEAIKDCDMVVGWRLNRKDTLSKRITSRLANLVRSRYCHDGLHDTGCSLKIYRAECVRKIKLYHGTHRFLGSLFCIEGFRIKEVVVNHRERTKGQSKYHFFNRSLSPFVDMLAVHWMSKRRLRYEIKEQL